MQEKNTGGEPRLDVYQNGVKHTLVLLSRKLKVALYYGYFDNNFEEWTITKDWT